MALIFVAHSKQVAEWGGDVGLGKNLFLLEIRPDEEAALAFLAEKPCGGDDWKVLKKEETELEDCAGPQSKLAGKEKRIDPGLYPRLRGFGGLFKIKPENVENHFLVKKALEGLDTSSFKLKPADIATYILHNALK